MGKRWWHVVVLGLLFGCVANVGVAWWCHLKSWMENRHSRQQRYHGEFRPSPELAAAVPKEWMEPVYAKPDQWLCTSMAWEGFGTDCERFDILSLLPSGTTNPWPQVNKLVRFRAGWPWLALRGEVRVEVHQTSYDAMVHLFGLNPSPQDAVPLRPIWPGFIANSVLFGAIGTGVFVFGARLVRTARERARTRLEVCRRCGYGRAGIAPDAACPECGR